MITITIMKLSMFISRPGGVRRDAGVREGPDLRVRGVGLHVGGQGL